MTFEQLRIGVETFTAYVKDHGKHDVCAMHDELWVCRVSPHEMEPRHVAKLGEQGWHWDNNAESWRHFT